MQLSTHFKSQEFDSPDLPSSGINMDKFFIHKLQQARTLANVSFIINSGYRTKAHNKTIKGSVLSAHLNGYAADIRVSNNQDRFLILFALLQVGFKRIGVYQNHIHVDLDPTKFENSIWHR